MNISFSKSAFEEYNDWQKDDKLVHSKIKKLIAEIIRTPFHGTGKPEALKQNLNGYWSRRITDEHRIVYKVLDSEILIISCKFHYEK